MKMSYRSKNAAWVILWLIIVAAAFFLDRAWPGAARLPSGHSFFGMAGIIASILAASNLLTMGTIRVLAVMGKPISEALMIGRMYQLLAFISIALSVAYGFGRLAAFGTFFTLFGGMLLGWSLQAPVSGFAAWILVSLKRPFRPGDRIQFPSLGLVGDIKDIEPMYTILNQVGGSVGSEEASGRFIMVPNAMLFSQVVINYTVTQKSDFMLDEVVIRITYDSDWKKAESILLDAANEVTGDIVASTGQKPYIRSDLYDYGVYLRLRYLTRAMDRAQTSYEITKRIFITCQHNKSVDFAIPYVYSYRAAAQKKEDDADPLREKSSMVRDLAIDRIRSDGAEVDPFDLEQLVKSIAEHGLLQPIVVSKLPDGDIYEIIAGRMKFEACKKLKWSSVPVIQRKNRNETLSRLS